MNVKLFNWEPRVTNCRSSLNQWMKGPVGQPCGEVLIFKFDQRQSPRRSFSVTRKSEYKNEYSTSTSRFHKWPDKFIRSNIIHTWHEYSNCFCLRTKAFLVTPCHFWDNSEFSFFTHDLRIISAQSLLFIWTKLTFACHADNIETEINAYRVLI